MTDPHAQRQDGREAQLTRGYQEFRAELCRIANWEPVPTCLPSFYATKIKGGLPPWAGEEATFLLDDAMARISALEAEREGLRAALREIGRLAGEVGMLGLREMAREALGDE